MKFSADELADKDRAIKRLVLAAQDMGECRAAVDFLSERDDIPGDVRRALETAAPVAYARPWGKSNSIGALGSHWLPSRSDQLALHKELILVRNKVYAHTDEEIGARWVSGMDEALKRGIAPAWRPLNLDLFPEIAGLAESQKVRFADAAQELLRK